MSTPFNQGAPTVPVVLNTSNCFVFGNTASGNALSVQQFGTGNVASFRTATGATAMFVNAAGNVGIGTASPGYVLDVNGSGRFNTGTSNVLIGNGQGPGQGGLYIIPNSSLTGSSWKIGCGLQGSYSNAITIDSGCNFGIATTNPQYPLDVAGQPRFSIQPVIQAIQLGIASSAAASWYRLASLGPQARAKFRIYTIGANLQEQVVVTTSWSAAYSGYPTLRIEDQSSATFAGTQPLYNGQIRTLVYVSSNGIWYLEVYLSSVATAYTLYVQLIEGDASGASITLTSPIVPGSIPANYIAQPTVPVNAFSVTPWNTTSNVSFLITNNGNVGIGTTSPIIPLHVQGNIAFCMTYTPTKYYSYEWTVAASQGASSIIFTFANPGFFSKIIIFIRDAANAGNLPNVLSGEFTGGNIYANTPGANIAALVANTRNTSAYMQLGAITYGANTITIAVTAASTSGGTIAARVELMGSTSSQPSLTTIQYPTGTIVYTPAY